MSGVEPDAAHAGDIIPTHPWARGLATTSSAALLLAKVAWRGAEVELGKAGKAYSL